jgi:hypothetical protein
MLANVETVDESAMIATKGSIATLDIPVSILWILVFGLPFSGKKVQSI